MTGFFLLLAAIVLVLAVIAALFGRLSNGEDGEKSSMNPVWLVFAAALFVGFCYCAFLASKWEQ
ncbi:hypothetical protein CO690_00085 (plasmid) [Rothia mucilaginosa]|uniref:Uncharacterized protein n=1 Tax=Rothia mucilaginosa TaxID=43675 RepID=A0A291DCW7_9MICC|nr:hypothetical protein [Rothia mucilaginosa]ATF62149.1 hypothetical protein CO690_00085 [Rothia mucilaginosa]